MQLLNQCNLSRSPSITSRTITQYGPGLESVFNGYSKPLTVLWDISTTQGTNVVILVANESKRIYVDFRGTDGEEEDFETNLNFDLVPYGDDDPFMNITNTTFLDGKVHEGFNLNLFGLPNKNRKSNMRSKNIFADGEYAKGQYVTAERKLYLTLDEQIRSVVSQYGGDYQLTISGHSLGGALAILYGAHVAKNVLPDTNIAVLTIGTPRVGDRDFKRSVRSLANLANWRVVYRLDVIPRIPLDNMGYRHAGHLIFLRGNETAAYFEQTGDLENYAGVGYNDFALPTRLDERLAIPVFHHIPWSYLHGLASAKKNGYWPTQFVPYKEQEKICCRTIFRVWCVRYEYPPCS